MAMAEAVMAVSLDKLQQLFNSFDPSSFPERDLDHDAEEYIVRWAELDFGQFCWVIGGARFETSDRSR